MFLLLRDISRDARSRLFLGWDDLQIAQEHPMTGTPVEAPQPRIVILKELLGTG